MKITLIFYCLLDMMEVGRLFPPLVSLIKEN